MLKNQWPSSTFQKSSYIKKVSTFFFIIFLFSFSSNLKDDRDNSQEEKLISLDEEEEESSQLNKLEKSNFGNNFRTPFKNCKKLVIDNPIQFCILCLDTLTTILIN